MRTSDEAQATRVLDTAFAGDPRLVYAPGGWRPAPRPRPPRRKRRRCRPSPTSCSSSSRRPRGAARALVLTAVAVARRRGDAIVAATGGESSRRWSPPRCARAAAARARARPIVHAPPGGLAALEEWLDEPLDDPLPLPLLGRRRTRDRGRPRRGGPRRAPRAVGARGRRRVGRIELVAACFDALRRPARAGRIPRGVPRDVHAVPWTRYAFTRDDVKGAPPHAGTYRFFDADDRLLYVGKSKNLRGAGSRRGSATTRARRARRAIVDAVHRFELQPSGSELEALLREAAQIARELPGDNVQRHVRASTSARRSGSPRS